MATVEQKLRKRLEENSRIKTFNFDWPAQESVSVRLRDILETDVDERYYLSEEKTAKLVAQLRDRELTVLENRQPDDINPIYTPDMVTKNQNGIRIKEANDVSPSLTVQDRHGIVEGLAIKEATTKGYAVAAEGDAVAAEGDAVAAEGDAVNFQFPDSKTRRGRVGKQIAQTLEASGINQGVVEQFSSGLGVSCCVDANYTKGTAPGDVGKGRRTHIVESRYRIRKLTPLECWRLQGFPDEAHEAVKAAGISDSQRYRQAGNAVTVNVISAIGRRLLPYL